MEYLIAKKYKKYIQSDLLYLSDKFANLYKHNQINNNPSNYQKCL